MTDSIKAYIESLETDTAHTESEWREIIEAERADFEKQDERFARLTEAEIDEILEQLDIDGYILTKTQQALLESGDNMHYCKPFLSSDKKSGYWLYECSVTMVMIDGHREYVDGNADAIYQNLVKLAKAILSECPDNIVTYNVTDICTLLAESGAVSERGCASCPEFKDCDAMEDAPI